MESKVTEIARDIYRISTFHPEIGIQFNLLAALSARWSL